MPLDAVITRVKAHSDGSHIKGHREFRFRELVTLNLLIWDQGSAVWVKKEISLMAIHV